MAAHICSPSTWMLRQEDHELVTSLCYVEKLCIKKPHNQQQHNQLFLKDEAPLKFLVKHI